MYAGSMRSAYIVERCHPTGSSSIRSTQSHEMQVPRQLPLNRLGDTMNQVRDAELLHCVDGRPCLLPVRGKLLHTGL